MALLPPDPVFCLKPLEPTSYYSLCFRTPEHLYAGTVKGTVQLWELQTNRTSYQLSVGSSAVLNLAHTDDALLTQEKDGAVKLWALADADYVLRHEISTEHIGFCRMAHDTPSGTVIIPREGSAISVLCAKTFSETMRFTPPPPTSASATAAAAATVPPYGSVMCFRPIELQSQRYLLAGYESGALILWDYRTGRPVAGETVQLRTADADCLFTVDYDPVTNRGVAGGSSDRLFIFSIDRKTQQVARKTEITIKNPGIHRVTIRPDLKVFASAGWDGRIRIFSWKSLRPLAVLTEHKGELLDIGYSQGKVTMWNAPIMAAAGTDGQISLWDLYK